MTWFKNKPTRALILIMSALVLFGIIISFFYYKKANSSVDPRIQNARKLYDNYNKYAQFNDFDSVFFLMDTVESVYSNIKHYNNSYEIGVLYNNRAAAFLTMALSNTRIDKKIQDSLINLSDNNSRMCIGIYNGWLEKYTGKLPEDIEKTVSADYYHGLEKYTPGQRKKFFNNRIKEINEALVETKRRLSVTYTNLGIVYRYKHQYDSAAIYYKKAINLWDKNYTAENNLNLLLGRPQKKRNFIQKLFPPNRN